jgi:group I intron endonuclease
MIGIYKITNPNGNSYIGQSRDIEHRFYYYRLSSDWIKEQRKLYNSLKKYGYENHVFEVIEECSEGIINEREIYWIYFYNSVEQGLNLKYGGIGGRHSEETKQNISKSLMGKKQSKETIEKRSKSLQGLKRSDYTKQLMSESKKGKPITWGNKISESKKKSNYIFSQEHKNKISKNSPHSKPIEQYTPDGILSNIYPSAMEAMRQTGVKNDNIHQNLKNKTKSAGGFIWKYKE